MRAFHLFVPFILIGTTSADFPNIPNERAAPFRGCRLYGAINFKGQIVPVGSDTEIADLGNDGFYYSIGCDPGCTARLFKGRNFGGEEKLFAGRNPTVGEDWIERIFSAKVNCNVARGLENNVNRPGSDYRVFTLSFSNPKACQDYCWKDRGRCAAWTMVRPGIQSVRAVCWLKNRAPAPVPSDCCVSGALPDERLIKGKFFPRPPIANTDGARVNQQ